MADPRDSKSGSRPPDSAPRAEPRPQPTARMRNPTPPKAPTEAAPPKQPCPASGRVVHDARGNAVWDWMKESAQAAIESTSRLLKKLEVPELKVEEKPDEELRLEPDRDEGGGYDPYSSTPRRGRR